MKRVAVIGAGFCEISATTYLAKAGLDVTDLKKIPCQALMTSAREKLKKV